MNEPIGIAQDRLVKQYMSFFSCKNAASTAGRVKYQLYQFLGYMERNGATGLHQLDCTLLLSWTESLKARMEPRTVCSYQTAVKGFIDWLCRQDYFLVSPWPEYMRPKRLESIPKAVPGKRQALQFMDKLQEECRFPDRNRAIIELCYGSGLRRGELHGLNLADVRGDWIKVTGKGDNERLVPLGSKAKAWINTYLRGERRLLVGKHNPLEEALFLNQYGNRLGIQMYSYLVSTRRPADARWTLHSFRHACATHMLENGASIRVLQKLLGHKKLSSTQVYTRVEVSSLKEVLKKYHPRG